MHEVHAVTLTSVTHRTFMTDQLHTYIVKKLKLTPVDNELVPLSTFAAKILQHVDMFVVCFI